MTVIDAYDVSLRTTQRTLEAAQHEADISKKECTELENKIKEMEKKMAVLKDNNEQQADKLEILQHKGIHEVHTIITVAVYIRTYRTRKNWLVDNGRSIFLFCGS